MDIYGNIIDAIGNTPMLELGGYARHIGAKARLLVKLENRNPGGSIKDRVAARMLLDAEDDGRLTPDTVIIEPTSGNTGIGLAALCAVRGYRLIIVMPDSMSVERRKLMSAYGAELVLTPGALGMSGAIAEAERIAASHERSFIAGQFVNPSNPKAHYLTTAPEIWSLVSSTMGAFVAGAGTGGTVTGVGRYIKEHSSSVLIAAAEPAESAVLSGRPAGRHGIQGIGAGFVPDVYDPSVVDEVLAVPTSAAADTARLVARTDGLLAGFSGGCNIYAAGVLACRSELAGRDVVTVLPDSGDRYLSTELY